MKEIKLKTQYIILMAVFTLVNLTVFIHTKNWLLPFSKVEYIESQDGFTDLAVFALLTLAASVANIYALKECKRENIKSFLILTMIDTLSIALSVALIITWNNFKRPGVATTLGPEPVLLLALYSIKSIAIGFFWHKKPENKPGQGEKSSISNDH